MLLLCRYPGFSVGLCSVLASWISSSAARLVYTNWESSNPGASVKSLWRGVGFTSSPTVFIPHLPLVPHQPSGFSSPASSFKRIGEESVQDRGGRGGDGRKLKRKSWMTRGRRTRVGQAGLGKGPTTSELTGFSPQIDRIFPSSTSKRYLKG